MSIKRIEKLIVDEEHEVYLYLSRTTVNDKPQFRMAATTKSIFDAENEPNLAEGIKLYNEAVNSSVNKTHFPECNIQERYKNEFTQMFKELKGK